MTDPVDWAMRLARSFWAGEPRAGAPPASRDIWSEVVEPAIGQARDSGLLSESEWRKFADAINDARGRKLIPDDEPAEEEPATVCPEHLRFVPCRLCKGEPQVSTDAFMVEIARRYQAGELKFTLDVDAPLFPPEPTDETPDPVAVPTNDELAERAKDSDARTVVWNWLRRHVRPPHSGMDYTEWLDWAAENFLADPEVRAHLVPVADREDPIPRIVNWIREMSEPGSGYYARAFDQAHGVGQVHAGILFRRLATDIKLGEWKKSPAHNKELWT